MPDDLNNEIRDGSLPVSENLRTSKIEQLQELVNFLVSNYQEINRNPKELSKQTVIGGHNLKVYEDWLEKVHTYFREASSRDLTLSLAAEWVLDNYYIIRQALLQIDEDLPAGFYKQLPKLAGEPLKGLPRIYAIARAVLSFQNYLLNTMDLQVILSQVQEHVPLTMGELWALPIFLRYSLIETLAQALEWVIRPDPLPGLPVFPPQLVETGNPFSANQGSTTEPLASGVVANIILSLRNISDQNWNDFFESVSSVEQTLREDPAGIYPLMDFKTRDLYRKEIEALALASRQEENELAKITLELARGSNNGKSNSPGLFPESDGVENPTADPLPHPGDYLLGKSRIILEQSIGYQPDAKTSFKRWGTLHASTLYLSGILSLSLLLAWLISDGVDLRGIFQSGSAWQWISVLVLSIALLVPILTVSASLVNWLVTLRVKPRILPKLNFIDGIPAPFQSLVVIPALITSQREIDNLSRQLEMNFLRNQETGLLFALLTDFGDADSETLPEDEEMVSYASDAIEKLNAKYGRSIPDNITAHPSEAGNPTRDDQTECPAVESEQLFYLLHRKRLWNQSEGRWMGWERKRGKLHELNQLLRGSKDTSFTTITSGTAEWAELQCVRFVITLDADTILPRGAARRLAGTLAHPLNHAKFNDSTGQILSGYTVLQPRMEIHPRSANYSWFTRIFAGDTGLDLYTRAVSDAYQDLFGEGSYVGKGIYDVDAFERSVRKRIPENSVLSHDLLEGIMGRAGLVTDITMIEDYPSNYFIQIKRQQRWIRGDWQLLPWLIQPGRFKSKFTAVDRWKMLDNLLRSMLAPALLVIFFLGIITLPGLTLFWMAIILLSLGIPVLTSLARSALQTLGGERVEAAFHSLGSPFARWLLALAFLPYEAYNALDAILTTLYRLLISHHDLLQWTTAAQTARLFGLQVYRNTAWLRMIASTLMAVLLAGGIQLVHRLTGNVGTAPSLIIAAPLLFLWMFSPVIAQLISLPIVPRTIPLSAEQVGLFRQVARRTWGFFERFVGPEDHWLPPDHFQELPVGIIAHHTSPSNIGLLFTSTLAAYDFGYLDQLGLATRLSITMDTLDKLERFRGHFLNWYDTLTLQPLTPRYISTVDSGNLAASLIVTAQTCHRMEKGRIFRWDLWQGYLDTLANLTEILKGMRKAEFDRQVEEINQRIAEMHAEILAVRAEPARWFAIFQNVNGQFWPDLSKRLIELVSVGGGAFDLDSLRKLQEVAAQVERHHQGLQRTLTELVPWIQLLEQAPVLFKESQFEQELSTLRANLPYNPPLGQVGTCTTDGLASTAALRLLLKENQLIHAPDSDPVHEASNGWWQWSTH
jgi:cyclic beta-1,2-glucan synthetase